MRWSDNEYSQVLTRDFAWCVIFLCVVTQPLGVEVVPLVYIINARRSIGHAGLNGGRVIDVRWESGESFMNGMGLVIPSCNGFSTF